MIARILTAVATTAMIGTFAAACGNSPARDPGAMTRTSAGDVGHADTVGASAAAIPSPASGPTAAAQPSPASRPTAATHPSAASGAAATSSSSGTAAAPRHVSVQGIDLTGVGYDRGSATAPVVVVDFSDFGCPFCGAFARETYPSIEEEYVRTGKVFFKYVPFVMGMFPNGDQAARAGECAGDQGRFWPMYERLYAGQNDWKHTRDPLSLFQRYATAAGVSAARFTSCYQGQQQHPRTTVANGVAERLGIRATPTFFINGHMLEGALPLPQFRQLLDQVAQEGR